MDIEESIKLTVDENEKSLQPDQWPVHTEDELQFSAKFPKTPVRQTEDKTSVISAMDHRYGQFMVIVNSYSPGDKLNPSTDIRMEKLFIKNMLQEFGAAAPDCRQAPINTTRVVYCKFDVPAEKSTVLVASIFLPERTLRILNQAPSDSFNLDVAQMFVNSLEF